MAQPCSETPAVEGRRAGEVEEQVRSMSRPLSKKDRPLTEFGELIYRGRSVTGENRPPPEFIFFLQGQGKSPDNILSQECRNPTETHDTHDAAEDNEPQMQERIQCVDLSAIGSASEMSRWETAPARFGAMGSINPAIRIAVKIRLRRYGEDRGFLTLVSSTLRSPRLFPGVAAAIAVIAICGLVSRIAFRNGISGPTESSSKGESSRVERTAEGLAGVAVVITASPPQSSQVAVDRGESASSESHVGEKEASAVVEGTQRLVGESDASLSASATQQPESAQDAATRPIPMKMQESMPTLEKQFPPDKKLPHAATSMALLSASRPDVASAPSTRRPPITANSDSNAELTRRKKLTSIRARLIVAKGRQIGR